MIWTEALITFFRKSSFTFTAGKFVAVCSLTTLLMPLAVIMEAKADDYIAPQLVKVTTPRYKANFEGFTPRLGTYNYVVSWQGIPAASAAVRFSENGGNFIVDAQARTNSAIDLLYKLRYQAIGTLSSFNLKPVKLWIDHRENSRIKNIDLQFSGQEDLITAVRTRVGSTERKEVSFRATNTLDPIGAGFLARSLSWSVGETKSFDVFNGKSRYLISLTALDKRVIDFQGTQRECFVISPRVRNLTTTKAVEKLREAFIYVTTDKFRDVLKIESSVFIGTVLTEMESFIPEEASPPPSVQLAQSENDDTVRAQPRMQ